MPEQFFPFFLREMTRLNFPYHLQEFLCISWDFAYCVLL
jgi:hypothetical protein